MRHHRFRVILLSLGVALGYGSAFAQFVHARHNPHAGPCSSWTWPGTGAPKEAVKKSQ